MRSQCRDATRRETARKFGAEGIGLCRTEHMFFDPRAHGAVRQMIMANDEAAGAPRCAKLLPLQRDDFVALFRIMAGLPVTIRLLDPPLHEFLPHGDAELAEVAEATGHRHRQHARGVPRNWRRPTRCSVIAVAGSASPIPKSDEMQARAIFEARWPSPRKPATAPVPEIMIPLVGIKKELEITRAQVDKVPGRCSGKPVSIIEYTVGTMIELPRAGADADAIAEAADFFSFGTNDLTQTTSGLSRDDAGKFLPQYVEKGILPKDPFVSIDIEGVGAMLGLPPRKGGWSSPG